MNVNTALCGSTENWNDEYAHRYQMSIIFITQDIKNLQVTNQAELMDKKGMQKLLEVRLFLASRTSGQCTRSIFQKTSQQPEN